MHVGKIPLVILYSKNKYYFYFQLGGRSKIERAECPAQEETSRESGAGRTQNGGRYEGRNREYTLMFSRSIYPSISLSMY